MGGVLICKSALAGFAHQRMMAEQQWLFIVNNKSRTNPMSNLSVKETLQFSVVIESVPGTLAKVAQALADAKVSIMAGAAGKTLLMFIVDKADAARAVFKSLGMNFSEESVLVVTYSADRVGTIATMASALGGAGINIEDLYFSSAGEGSTGSICVQVSKENLAKAAQVIASA
jgi:hypothetical protein